MGLVRHPEENSSSVGFIFQPTEFGTFIAHSYRFSPDFGTFVIECSPDTWRKAGLDTVRATSRAGQFAVKFSGTFSKARPWSQTGPSGSIPNSLPAASGISAMWSLSATRLRPSILRSDRVRELLYKTRLLSPKHLMTVRVTYPSLSRHSSGKDGAALTLSRTRR